MEEQRTIAIPCDTLERLIALLMKQYDRQPSREIKQARETIERLLQQAA